MRAHRLDIPAMKESNSAIVLALKSKMKSGATKRKSNVNTMTALLSIMLLAPFPFQASADEVRASFQVTAKVIAFCGIAAAGWMANDSMNQLSASAPDASNIIRGRCAKETPYRVVVESKTFTASTASPRIEITPNDAGHGRNWNNGTDARSTESVDGNRKYSFTPSESFAEGSISAKQITVHF
jgi:spore coat protein U-like protein